MAWDSTSYQMYILTNLANDLTVSADSGTPVVGQKMIFRFISTSTRTLTWTTGSSKSFRAMGVTLPTILTANKITYLGCIYNAVDLRWDVIAVGAEQ